MNFQAALQDWLASFLLFLPKLIVGLIIFVVTILVSNYVGKWVQKVIKRKVDNQEMAHLSFMITKWVTLIAGTILALDQVDFDVTSFVAGVGVMGFTVGFALQDIAKNFISGLLLLARQPFNIGDNVKIGDFLGKVKEINVRDTVIATVDGEMVIIPNHKVFENPITNYTSSTLRRRNISIGLGYDEDVDRAGNLFLETIQSVPGVLKEPEPTIRAEYLGDSALMLSANFWVDQKENDLIGVHSEVVKAIKSASDTHGINLPYPVQTVLVKNVSD